MSTREVERELTALLHRHAGEAMESTDTQTERERLYEILEVEPRTVRRRWVVAVAAAAAVAVAAAAVWAAGPGDEGAAPGPTQDPAVGMTEREAERLADRAVAAYADHDADAVIAYLSPDESAWPDLRRAVDRNRAWNAEYLLRSCRAETVTSIGVVVECPTGMHVFHSEEVGAGPFRGSKFSMLVRDGAIVSGDVTYPYETNGMGNYTAEVATWIEERHPEDAAFLGLDEPDVPAADWQRWLRLWEKRLAEYAAAMSEQGGARS